MHPQDTSFLVNGFKPTVALDDPLTVATKRQGLVNAQQQQQIGAQQLQQGAIDVQEKQRAYDEGQKLRALFAQPGMTMETALPQVMAINPTTGLALRKGMYEAQKFQFDVQKQRLENNSKTVDTLGSLAGSVHDDASLHQAIAAGVGQGLINPEDAQTLLTQGYDDPRTQASLTGMVTQAKSVTQQHDQALADLEDKRKAAQAAQDLADKQAEEARKAALHPLALTKATNEAATTTPNAGGLTPEQQKAADDRKAALDQKKLDDQRKNNIASADLAIKQKTFDATFGGGGAVGADGKPLHGEDFLKTLPQGRAAQVKAFASGAMDESDLPRGNAKQPFLDAVLQYDPTFNKQRAQTLKAFGQGGPEGKNTMANNTAVVHLDQLDQAATELENGRFKPGNKVLQDLRETFGGAAPTNFDGVKAAVKSEMATALKGNATDQEIAEIGKTVDRASSPKALHGIVNENLKILGAKLNTKDEAYHSDPGTGDPNWQPVLPTAKKVFDAHGIQPIKRLAVDPKLKSYADQYFGGDVKKAQAAIAGQK